MNKYFDWGRQDTKVTRSDMVLAIITATQKSEKLVAIGRIANTTEYV